MDTDEFRQLISGSSLGGGEPRMGEYTGTKALMLAVLENGLRSYCGPAGSARTEAEHWVRAANRQSPFSFIVVCETLGLEPTAVRTALTRLQPQPVPRQRRIRPNTRSV